MYYNYIWLFITQIGDSIPGGASKETAPFMGAFSLVVRLPQKNRGDSARFIPGSGTLRFGGE